MSTDEKQKKFQELKKKKLKERQEEASIVRKIVSICLLLLVIGFSIVGYFAYSYVTSALDPVDPTSEELIDIHIPIGSTSTRIGNILEENGLIKDANFFRYYIRYKNESGFQAGDYQLSKSMDIGEIIASLKDGTVYQQYALSFTVPEGRWLESILGIIAENTNHDLEALKEKVRDEEYLETLIDSYSILTEAILADGIHWPLEGYLFPSRYDFIEENPSMETIIEAMIQRTEVIIGKYFAELEDSEYNVHEIMTLASIIEGEAQKAEDRYKISGVLYNRLERNMRLEVDPSVAYAHGVHFTKTKYKHLDIDSPYNTYRVVGIPIGPINNPGEASIKAALQPEENDYLFFYARPDGQVMYSKTFQEHKQILKKYRD